MMKNLKVIAAKTHPPEYMLHKYWPESVTKHLYNGRKPLIR